MNDGDVRVLFGFDKYARNRRKMPKRSSGFVSYHLDNAVGAT